MDVRCIGVGCAASCNELATPDAIACADVEARQVEIPGHDRVADKRMIDLDEHPASRALAGDVLDATDDTICNRVDLGPGGNFEIERAVTSVPSRSGRGVPRRHMSRQRYGWREQTLRGRIPKHAARLQVEEPAIGIEQRRHRRLF